MTRFIEAVTRFIEADNKAALFLEEHAFPAVRAERERQVEKWGDQSHHPSVDRILMEREGGCTPHRMAEEYGIPTASTARANCQAAFRAGLGTWGHIFVEEIAEAIEAAVLHGDGPQLREELVQVMTVCAAWIQKLDGGKK